MQEEVQKQENGSSTWPHGISLYDASINIDMGAKDSWQLLVHQPHGDLGRFLFFSSFQEEPLYIILKYFLFINILK